MLAPVYAQARKAVISLDGDSTRVLTGTKRGCVLLDIKIEAKIEALKRALTVASVMLHHNLTVTTCTHNDRV